MTLADLIRRGVALEWYESVALVRAVIQYLRVAPQSSVFPDLREIDISDAGDVTILAAGRVDDPVGRANQLLHALIVDSEPPIQLRLLLSRASFGSMTEYDESLAYFERPARPKVMAGLHARAAAKMQEPEAIVPVEEPTLDTIAPKAEPPKEVPAPVVKATPSRAMAAAAMLLFAVSAAAAVALYTARSAPASPSGASALAHRASETLSEVVKSGLSTVSESTGFGRLVFDDPRPEAAGSAGDVRASGSPVPDPAPRNEVPKIAAVQGSRAGAAVAAHEDAGASAATVEPLPAPAAALAASAAAPPGAPDAGSHGSSTLVIEAFADNDPPIYSAQSPGVVPPVSLNPPLLPELPAHVDSSEFGKIELIIAPDGLVESVRLLRILGNVQHGLFLSAVKAWRFEPATKDGAPVRYREVVWLAPGLSKDSLAWRAGR
jgi:hypothetical protein